VIDHVYRYCGQKDTVIFCDQLMGMGFRKACEAGISFGIDDLNTPEPKKSLLMKPRSGQRHLNSNIRMV
jgi:DNA-directed RNA polymerase subunit beta'